MSNPICDKAERLWTGAMVAERATTNRLNDEVSAQKARRAKGTRSARRARMAAARAASEHAVKVCREAEDHALRTWDMYR